MLNEIICVIFGFAFGAIFMAFYNARANSILVEEIARLKKQVTLKAIFTPIILDLAKRILFPFFSTVEKSEESPKNGAKSKRKNNIHKRS